MGQLRDLIKVPKNSVVPLRGLLRVGVSDVRGDCDPRGFRE